MLLAASWDRQADRYAEGKFEPVRSGLANPRALAEQIVAEVSAGLARSPGQLCRLFAQSLAAHQGTLPDVEGVLREMTAAGMIEEITSVDAMEGMPRLRATRIGRIAVRHFLAPATVLLFRRALNFDPDMCFFDLLLVAAGCDDCVPLLPVDWEELHPLSERLAREPSHFLRSINRLVEIVGIQGRRLLAALKTAWTIRDWTRSGDAERTAANADCYPFEVRRLVDTMDRLLGAMSALCDSAFENNPSEEASIRERLRALHRMVRGGLDEETVTLTLVNGIGPVMARRLRAAGVEDLEALAQAEIADLSAVSGLSPARAGRWINQTGELVRTHSAFRYRETASKGEGLVANWPIAIDPYRLRRARDLKVAGRRGKYQVSGGLEPHRVTCKKHHWSCDCPDRADGFVCKHILAVRLHLRDRELHGLVAHLESTGAQGGLDLFALWFASETAAREGQR